MLILGLNCFHADSSAALVRDGKLVAAAEEERFCRVKHWAGFPSKSIGYCLREGGVSLAQVEHIALNQNSRANLIGKLQFVLTQRPDPRLVWSRWKNRKDRAAIAEILRENFGEDEFKGQVRYVEHHLAHLSSAFHVSPFENAAVVSVDGFGDFASAAWGVGQGSDIRVDGRIYFPHSLGIFYQALTQFLGFPHYGDEYKVMGLAPYGAPSFSEPLSQLVRLQTDGSFELDLRFFRHHRERVAYQWSGGSPQYGELFSPALEELLGPRRRPDEVLTERHRDIARSTQAMYENAFFNLLNGLQARTGLTTLALAGGCAMNSVANGKVMRETAFQDLYVQSAAGDAGGAIGAAFATWHQLGGARTFVMNHADWGPEFNSDYVGKLLQADPARLVSAGCKTEQVNHHELCQRTAAAIADGKVVGWFQGRMEWGPRALGNRSIVADPRRHDMKELLNSKIKRRESFRPFAPSVLREHVIDWFEEEGDVPFMTQVFQVRQEKRDLIPAVVHVDGSGRLQTVSEQSNPQYYRLIKEFYHLTSIPMVLNTSFNENEPIVCSPDEALECFLRTKMDWLVMDNWIVQRPS